jgi:putative transposase
MPNHIHLLVGVAEESNLSRFMKRLNLKYFYYYKKKHNYSGHLWQDRFKSKIIDKDEYFIQCGKYIELNPVRAYLVLSPADYLFSSYRHYSLGFKDELVDDDPLYIDLSNATVRRQERYRSLVINEIVPGSFSCK